MPRMPRKDRIALTLLVLGVVVALVAAQQHDWQTAGAVLLSIGAFVGFRLAGSQGWLAPKFHLDRFRQRVPAEEELRKPLDPRALAPIMVTVVLGWEGLVLGVGDVVLGLPTWAVFIGIFAVIPLALAVGFVLVRRLPTSYR
jgi:hypothetical protein